MAICSLCGQEKKLCKAHILSEAFYRAMWKSSTDNLLFAFSGSEKYPKCLRKGIYDNGILCAECDGKIGIYEDIAQNFLLNFEETEYKRYLSPTDYYLEVPISEKIYHGLKLFFISFLYRASITKRREFIKVNLGQKFEGIAKNCILNDTDNSDFGVVIAKLRSEKYNVKDTVCFPAIQKIGALNGYTCTFAGFKFWMKVDQRKIQENMRGFELKPKISFFLPEIFEKTPEYTVFLKLIRRTMKE